ncbi:Katanin p80 WD40 repeat-containing subunit B1-like [Oopsacas minuta]|uniref:Katanin p80 WD40 repeat-containing subunit B1-like n=1 Tax=Oopsacas minuta TaxID=111878 RepID=A0AAV7JGR0_9METZ|nr:Katanin p80 WD40 repeat-containing subunit B1-like [Oopsacas minuta]
MKRAEETHSLVSSSQDFTDAIMPKEPHTRGSIKPVTTMHSNNLIYSTDFCSPDTVAAGDAKGFIDLFQFNNCGNTLKLYSLSNNTYQPITAIKFRPGSLEDISNILLSTSSNGDVIHWHVPSKSVLSCIREERQVLSCAYSSDGLSFATCGSDSKIIVYDEEKLCPISTLDHFGKSTEMSGHIFRVFSVKYYPDMSNLLATSGWDGSIHFWDMRVSQQSVMHLAGPLVCADSIAFNPTGDSIVTGSFRKENPLQVWSVRDGSNSSNFNSCAINSQLYAATWLDSNLIACGGTNKSAVYLVRYPDEYVEGEALNFAEGIYCLGSSSKLKNFCVGSGSSLYMYSYK